MLCLFLNDGEDTRRRFVAGLTTGYGCPYHLTIRVVDRHTLLTQRQGRDIEGVMAKMLGPRVGRLDTLLSKRDGDRATAKSGQETGRGARTKASP